MAAPTDRNGRIALAKGWVWKEVDRILPGQTIGHLPYATTPWRNPEGKPARRPDFVGTLEGVSGMLRELQEEQDRKNEARLYRTDARLTWSWTYLPHRKEYLCILENEVSYQYEAFVSPDDRPGDCVGDAYLFVKEAADASTEQGM